MKNFYLLAALCLLVFNAGAQTFTDNFDTYTAGAYLGPQSPDWTTWSGTQGGSDDIMVNGSSSYSGSNCLYFTSTSANGGPSDIILPLGGQHNTGSFTYSHMMKVASGKKGYFNFQNTSTPGQTWHSNIFFTAAGEILIDDAEKQVFKGSYPQNAWFEFKLVANLNTNSWEVFVNNSSQGKFETKTYQIASIDYYATDNNNVFWIDDVSYTYTAFTMPARNGAISKIDIANGLVTQTRNANLSIRNLGTTAITSFKVDLVANGTPTTETINNVNIASGADYSFVAGTPVSLVNGLNSFSATIKDVNVNGGDDYAGDDTKSIGFTPVKPGDDKIVVAEEGTGTWCGWCPRGAVMLEKMHKNYDGFFQGIAVHNGDPMTLKHYDSAIGTKISGYPSALVDRGADIDPSAIEAEFLQKITLTPIAKLNNGAQYDANTQQLDVSVTTNFKQNASGDYRIACVIVEDSVTGSGAGWSQANYYAGGSKGTMGGYETLSNPVPAAQMHYDHVARAIAPDFYGIPNSFPATVNSGTSITHNFSFNIANWQKNKIHIVGLLIAPNGSIENASTTTIDKAVQNGYVLDNKDVSVKSNFISVYPNPATSKVSVLVQSAQSGKGELLVFDLHGSIIAQKNISLIDGLNQIELNSESWSSGSYIIQANINGASYQSKLLKQ